MSLYQQIFDPAEPMLEGARHVFVVPDGALQSLPLGVLVTEEPEGPVWKFSGYHEPTDSPNHGHTGPVSSSRGHSFAVALLLNLAGCLYRL